MKEMKRIISMVLCLVMVLSLLPVGAVRVHAATIETGAVVDAMVVMSDVHINTNSNQTKTKKQLVQNVMNAIKADFPNVSTVNSAGDMFSSNEGTMSGNASTVTDWVDDVFNVPVHYVWSDHDRAASDISKESRLVYGTGSGENYYVYLLSMADLSSWDRYKAGFYSASEITKHIEAFETIAAGLDKSKPLFIVGHQPLFDDRGDNGYAYQWVTAINEVAATMDVAYFFGHNHKYDDNQKSYYYAKGETMPVPTTKVLSGSGYSTDLESKDVKLNFTHINAGYMNPETTSNSTQTNARLGTALAVVISENAIHYVTYNKNGVYTSDFAVDETVNRDHKLTSISVEAPTKVKYALGEELDLTGMTVTATYGSTKKVAVTEGYTLSDVDMTVAGEQTVTVSYQGKTATFTINVVAPVVEDPTLESIAITTAPTTVEYTVGDTFSAEGLVVTATYSNGSTEAVTGYTLSEVDMTTAGEKEVTVTYEGMTATFKITVKAAEPTNNTVECWDDTNQVKVVATGLGLTAVTATNVTGKNEKCDEIFTEYGYAAFDIALTGLVEGEFVDYSISVVPDLDITNLELYYIDENDELTPVECRVTTDELNNVYVEFTADYDGTFVYGSPKVPDGYVLTSLTLANIPYDVFKGTTVDLTKAVITATYTMEGAEDFGRNLTIYDYDSETAFSGFDVNEPGDQTVVFTFEGLTATAPIYVWDSALSNGGVSVALSGAEFGVTGVTAVESTNTHVADAVANVMSNYVAYDISLIYAENYAATEDIKTVTLPIPEGVVNPVVYYVSDNGYNVVDMKATVSEDGKTVSFETKHFSTYVVGENTEIEVPDAESANGSGTNTTTEEKEAYVLVSTPTAGKQYLIVNRNTAGSGYALKENTTTGSSITVNAAGNGISAPYIETTDETIMWNAASDITFQSENGGYYLRYNSGLTFSTRRSTEWTVGANTAYVYSSSRYRYVYNNNGAWTTSSSRNTSSSYSVYFYEKQTVEVETTTTVSGTYSIDGQDETVPAIKDATVNLSSSLIFTPESGDAITTADPAGVTYEIYEGGDPLGVISKLENGTVTLSGNVGKALVKVSYTTDFGVVTDYITITTTTPDHYTIQLHLNEGGTLGEEITKPVALKGIEAGDTYSVWAVVKAYVSAEDTEGVDIGTLGDALTWTVSDESIATINKDTGVITFTGTNYGTFDVTVAYEGADKKPYTDTITISATKSLYVVPGDGTNDFPEYPNQGAVRFDKTATAVGNYSQTGIAKVELSMTGVPYTSGNRLDVVLMLDRSSSMYKDGVKHRISSTVEATKAFIKNIVMNEDGTFNNNRILVLDFLGGNLDSSEGGGSNHKFQSNQYTTNEESGYQVINSQAELDALLTKIENDFKGQTSLYGTEYAQGLELCYNALKNSKGDGNQQFCVFMSDGIPNYMMGETTHFKKTDDIVATFDVTNRTAANGTATRNATKYEYEHYSTQMKNEGVTVFTVGLGLKNTNSAWSGTSKEVCEQVANMLLNDISGPAKETDAQRDTGNAVTKLNKYFFSVADDNAAADMKNVFGAISQKIVEAARDVTVEDKIGNNYTLNFKLPTGVTNTEAGMSEFYIQVLEYQLDSDKERTGTPVVLENFTFDANGAIKSHTVNGTVTCRTECTHVTFATGRVTGINGTHFTYTCAPKLDANGNEVKNEVGDTITEEFLTWNADKLTTTELVLEYFAYLDNSAGYDADHQVPAGTYYTNEYATLTYKNYLGNEVQQEFPIPQMTWNGAQVTYVFYLVNDAGQPVNRAGRVIPFAESVYVTDPVTFNVTWNEQTGSENILAHDIFAEAGVPEVYELYDDRAQYVIRVYQTENVDKNGVNGNYFQISGSDDKLIDSALDSDTYVNNSTTVVFNTKAGKKYDAYGYYSIYNAKTTLTNGTTDITTTVKADDIDYANTTVAFAVVWKPELVEDTVVIDYGLDVVIDVIKNDNMAAGVVGVRTDAPKSGSEDVKINSGIFTSAKAQTVDVYIDTNNDSGNLKENKIGTATVENLNQVRFSLDKDNGMQFTDPAEFYYEADVNYYDSNNDLQTTSMYSKVTVIPATTVYYEDEFLTLESYSKNSEGNFVKDDKSAWVKDGTTLSKVQDQDRPGESKISAALDADNVYGHDSAYETIATHSLGSSAMITVTANTRGEATFTFYGTGFDVISTTSNVTGTLIIQVTDADGNLVKNAIIDTFYGMDADGSLSPNRPEALYQVPVMKIAELPYAQYNVKIVAGYNDFFNHTEAVGEYTLYLDAIRIYDPTGNLDETANDAYKADDEAWPTYQELRNNIIAASNYVVTENENGTVTVTGTDLSGAIFIDCNDATTSIADYVSFGPNNELYLANNQAIAFTVSDNNIADIQLGIKVANGGSVTYEINGEQKTVNTATDMYYSILDYARDGQVVTIKNLSGGILSLTNIKVTHTEAPANESGISLLSMDGESAGVALMMLRRAPVIEEEVPETIVPEETEPEVTEPEVTEPEATDPSMPDNTELKAAVEAVKKLKEKDYTKESFKALDKAVKSAEKVLKDKKVTQEKIDEALADLNEAVEALEANTPATKPGKDEKPNQNKPGKEEKPAKETEPAKNEKPADNKPGKPENNDQNKSANNKGHAAAVEQAQKVADTVGAIAEALFGWMFR